MCGILYAETENLEQYNKAIKELKPRGPDETNIFTLDDGLHMGHTRLVINNLISGKQPLHRLKWTLIFNGEIYNHEKDGDYILDMVDKYGPIEAPKHLDGIFAYVLHDYDEDEYYAVRDPVGVIPLYIGKRGKETWIASELKAISFCDEVSIIDPGHVVTKHKKIMYRPKYPSNPTGDADLIRDLLVNSVKKRIPKVPWGILLSGGLDSSILCGILTTIDLPKEYPTIHSFTIGMKDSPDLVMARKQAELCNTVHHEFIYDAKEGFEFVYDTIEAIETYDVTTVRASIPQYMLGQIIKKLGIKVVLSGEGADELFAGYLYNKFSPSPQDLHNECIRKMEDLHYYDCCRTNKTLAANGIECRVPFLDKQFVRYVMNIDPKLKMSNDKIEKHILREAFKDVLHPDIYKRQKAQFSDAVGSKWIEALQDYADNRFIERKVFMYQPPMTREARVYRSLFHYKYPEHTQTTCKYHHDTVACSSSVAHTWSKFESDPSAKSLYK